jgi:hypothetical protein
LTRQHPEFGTLEALFDRNPGTRAIVHIDVTRVSTSCGFAVPFMEFRADRDTLDRFAEAKGPEGLREYRQLKNRLSIDAMPALSEE